MTKYYNFKSNFIFRLFLTGDYLKFDIWEDKLDVTFDEGELVILDILLVDVLRDLFIILLIN